MAFEATKKEWSELYTLFRILADGQLHSGTTEGKPNEKQMYPVKRITRQEQYGTRVYSIGEEVVSIFPAYITDVERFATTEDEKAAHHDVSRKELAYIAGLILEAIRGEGEIIESPKEVETFLDRMEIYDLHSLSQDCTDMNLHFGESESSLKQCTVWTRIGNSARLLDGGRTANLKLEQTGIKFSNPTVSKINALETPHTVKDRILLIERLGGTLKYKEPSDKVFRANLAMLDLHLGRLLTEMVRTMHMEGISRISDLTARMKEVNPLKVNTELIEKHKYYEYKLKQLLTASTFGLRPTKIFTGTETAPEALIIINGDGCPCYYPTEDRNLLGEFLYQNIRLEKGSMEKDKYGYLEKENGAYYFKLNIKLGLTKR